jgi:two-component system chemotaxis response regulator CheY
MRILIAEDDKVSEILMKNYLKNYGECITAENGVKALNLFVESFDEKPFDLVCLDIMMPVMTGIEALKKIREFEESRKVTGLDHSKIIMVTALDQKSEVMEAFKSGCEAYIVKPISKADIKKALENLGITEKTSE